ncbi:adenosylcobinamide-phosphate synthase CbiB [Microvirga terrestris]|uniref:Cobalamin biosynthesis protein CobD n=1 Tax=Microvirga terrestris TaxID=2791024 RepID=A0ABS0HTA4_9HYPH|nr:adenosylcobinamide-phosphate synthase CbiB [Microvirga terrestris]MBF9196722.1 cobalamin biosynthesis protein CobD [Microvirga terrestris]
MVLSDSLLILSLALAAEAAVGYPNRLYTVIGHPVTWIGRLIKALDRGLNQEAWSFGQRRAAGIMALLVLLTVTGLAAWALTALLQPLDLIGIPVLAIIASSLIAQRSLHEHVAAVSQGLRDGGIEGGRQAVSMIVGRNPQSLDEAGVSRAAIESLAENFSDGIVAPAFWLGLGGLTGAVLYKVTNTADSMIGHRTPRLEAFGWAAARFDDVVNLPASRLSALLIIAAASLNRGTSRPGAWRAVRRDASHHRSPNAGWPEAAMAGALGLRLAGPRVYGDVRVEDRWMGNGRAEATAGDIDLALALYRTACGLLFGLASSLALLAWIILR